MARLGIVLLVVLSFVASSLAQTLDEAAEMVRQKRWTEAEQAYSRLQQQAPLFGEHLEGAVEASSQLNHWPRVVELYEKAGQHQILTVSQRVGWYEAALKSGQKSRAEQLLNALRNDYPRDENIVNLLAFYHLSRQDFAAAVATYRDFIAESPQATDSRINLALVLFKLQQGSDALVQLRQAFSIDFQAANTYFYRQLVRNMPPQGLADLADDVKRELGLPGEGVRANLALAREFEALDRYDPAIEHYRIYLDAEPGDQAVRYSLARLYYHVGDDATSEKMLAPLLEDTSSQKDEARLLAAELAIRSNHFSRAEMLLKQLPSAFQQRPLVQFFQARVALSKDELDRAERLLKQALAADPSLVQAYFHLGQLYLRTGRVEEGRRAMTEFQQRKP